MIVLPHLFSSGVHDQRGIAKKTMAKRPWNNCTMKGTVSTLQRRQVLLLKAAFVIFFLIKLCTPLLKLLLIVVPYYYYGVNRNVLYKYKGIYRSQG